MCSICVQEQIYFVCVTVLIAKGECQEAGEGALEMFSRICGKRHEQGDQDFQHMEKTLYTSNLKQDITSVTHRQIQVERYCS